MKIAAHTMGTPELKLDGAIGLFAELGFDGIEIIWDDEYQCALGKTATPQELTSLKRLLSAHDLELACLTPYMTGINALDPELRQNHLDDFRRCINVASDLGAANIRVYGGEYQARRDERHREQFETILIDSLHALGEQAAEAGVILVVETHFNTLTCSAAETANIVRRVNHPSVRVLYDQPNLEFSEREKHPEALKLLGTLIAMVHVKDLVYKEGAVATTFASSEVATVAESERRIRSRIVGDGIIPWPEILPALTAVGYDGWLSLEYERRWYPHDLPFAGEGMKQGLDYLRKILA